jgi:hypothetical protein
MMILYDVVARTPVAALGGAATGMIRYFNHPMSRLNSKSIGTIKLWCGLYIATVAALCTFPLPALAVDRFEVKIKNSTNHGLVLSRFSHQNADWDVPPDIDIKPGATTTASGTRRRDKNASIGFTYRMNDGSSRWELLFDFATGETATTPDSQAWLKPIRTSRETRKRFSASHLNILAIVSETWEVTERTPEQREIVLGKMKVRKS